MNPQLTQYIDAFTAMNFFPIGEEDSAVRLFWKGEEMEDGLEKLQKLKADLIAARETFANFDRLILERRKPLSEQIEKLEREFQESNAELFNNHTESIATLAKAEAALRKAITAAYGGQRQAAIEAGQDPDSVKKTVAEGLSVRVTEKLEYDEQKALGWCLVNAPYLVVTLIDKKGFNSAIEAMPTEKRPDFVKINSTLNAVIKLDK